MKPAETILPDGRSIVCIHLIYLSPKGTTESAGEPLVPDGAMTWKLACAPGLIEMMAQKTRQVPYLRSEDPRAVTCPMCEKSEQYALAMARMGIAAPARKPKR